MFFCFFFKTKNESSERTKPKERIDFISTCCVSFCVAVARRAETWLTGLPLSSHLTGRVCSEGAVYSCELLGLGRSESGFWRDGRIGTGGEHDAPDRAERKELWAQPSRTIAQVEVGGEVHVCTMYT